MAVTPARRRLIVNADDVGQTRGVNAGVRRAYEDGIVTSGSLMVRFDAAPEAAAWAGDVGFDLGLHVDLGEWSYSEGAWMPVYEVLPDTSDPEAVTQEVRHQLDRFRALVGGDPSHLDSHQHQHSSPPLQGILDELGTDLGVPVRGRGEISYDGRFYGQDGRGHPYPQAITTEALIDVIDRLEPGTTELGCHPGVNDDSASMYAAERAYEVTSLCDPRVRTAVLRADVDLVSFLGSTRGG